MKDYSQICSDPTSSLRQAALLAGCQACVSTELTGIQNYHDLLEDDWEEGHSTELDYLHQARRKISNLQQFSESSLLHVPDILHVERLETAPVWEGIAAHLANEVSVQTDLGESSDSVEIDPRMIGMAVREMAYAVQEDTEDGSILFRAFSRKIGEMELSESQCSLQPGKYTFLSVSAQGVELESWENLLPVMQFLTDDKESVPSPLQEAILCWLGAARLSKGEIFVSRKGIACGIFLALPVAASATPESLRARMINGRPETILLVDDEDMIWDVVFSMLKNLGYTVVLAEDGQQAVDIYEANPDMIDLVLLDMLMPVLNGRDAFYKLKEISPNAKVLLASGYVNEDDVADVLKNGAAGFLQKPYKLQDLAQKIRDIL